MPNVYTGCFYSAKTAPGRISIARRAPKGMEALPVFPDLAPGPWFNSVSEERYRYLYFQDILGRLDPADVVQRLTEMAERSYGQGVSPIMLCWEKNPDTDPREFCHRRMVAEWLHAHLGLDVAEVKTWPLPADDPSLPLF